MNNYQKQSVLEDLLLDGRSGTRYAMMVEKDGKNGLLVFVSRSNGTKGFDEIRLRIVDNHE